MIILGIDTSFDDTAAALVQDQMILSNVLSTDLSPHLEYGGIVPRLAKQSHINHIDSVIALALKRAKVNWNDIDAIAVTQGPGLSITLEIGIAKAKELTSLYEKPIVAVNHMEGHLLSFMCERKQKSSNSRPVGEIDKSLKYDVENLFPALGVLISGGHTQFVLVKKIGSYEIVGETQDDAMGECFDKVGRMLGLGYPAAAMVEKMAEKGEKGKIVFPVPMRQVKNANTSFSGLKTAALRIVEKTKEGSGSLSGQAIADIARGFQTACITHLMEKMELAYLEHSKKEKIESIILGGGVVANREVRKVFRAFTKKRKISLHLPFSKKLTSDNAAMIALVGVFKAQKRLFVDPNTLDREPNQRLDKSK